MNRKRRTVFAAVLLAVLSSACLAQTPPEKAAPKPLNAQDVMQKTLAAYTAAKTYQGNWSYTLEQGDGAAKQTQKMTLEIKSKAPNLLSFRLAPSPGQKTPPGGQPLPELRVVIDGKTAWFENTSDKSVYKVPLPAKAAISPLMFMPLIPSASQVERKPDLQAEGKTVIVLAAATPQGGTGQMEIDAATYRIRRVSTNALVGLTQVTSAVTMDKETFDADVPETTFSYKPARGIKEIPAPPEAAAMFGPPDKK